MKSNGCSSNANRWTPTALKPSDAVGKNRSEKTWIRIDASKRSGLRLSEQPRMDTDGTRTGGLEISQPHPDKLLHRETTEAIIGAAFAVHRELGYGFLEKVYQRALQVELLKGGYSAALEVPISVRYRGVIVGEYFANLLVDEKVIVETKVAPTYNPLDE